MSEEVENGETKMEVDLEFLNFSVNYTGYRLAIFSPCKFSDSKYFGLCGSHGLYHNCFLNAKAAIDNT